MSWHQVAVEADLAEGAMVTAVYGGWHILVARHDGELSAFNDRCTHQASLLSTGRLRRGMLMCPLHGARFDVKNGGCVGGAYAPLRQLALRVIDGMIEVELPDHPPGLEDSPLPSS